MIEIPGYKRIGENELYVSLNPVEYQGSNPHRILFLSRLEKNTKAIQSEVLKYLERGKHLFLLDDAIANNKVVALNPTNREHTNQIEPITYFDDILKQINPSMLSDALGKKKRDLLKIIQNHLQKELSFPLNNNKRFIEIKHGFLPAHTIKDLNQTPTNEDLVINYLDWFQDEDLITGGFGEQQHIFLGIDNNTGQIPQFNQEELEKLLSKNFEGNVGDELILWGRNYNPEEMFDLITTMYQIFENKVKIRKIVDKTPQVIFDSVQDTLARLVEIMPNGEFIVYENEEDI